MIHKKHETKDKKTKNIIIKIKIVNKTKWTKEHSHREKVFTYFIPEDINNFENDLSSSSTDENWSGLTCKPFSLLD